MCGWLFSRNEHAYLENQRRLAAEALAHTDPDGPAYERVLNMRDYMGWIIDNRCSAASGTASRPNATGRRAPAEHPAETTSDQLPSWATAPSIIGT